MLRLNRNLSEWSPCGRHLACALQQQLIVRNSKSLDITQSFVFGDTIESIGWSPNAQFIFCGSTKRAIIQIFSLQHPQWKCKLTGGSANFDSIIWSPDSKSVLVISDLKIYMSIWTLADGNIISIWNLKSSVPNIAVNKLRQNVAVIVCVEGTDSIEIYETDGWKFSRKLMCNKLFSIDGICWSKNGELLAIWCAIIGKSKLLVYSAASDSHIGAFSGEYSPDNLNFETIPYQYMSKKSFGGIEKVLWSPSGQLLAVAGSNEMIAVINHATWSVVLYLYFNPVIRENNYFSRVFKEVEINDKRDWLNCQISCGIPDNNHKYPLDEVNVRPINITIDVNPNDYEISIAITKILEFSPCGRYLVINHQLYPSTLWIWDLMDDSIDYILLRKTISGISWDPTCTRILIFSESSVVIEWMRAQKPKCFESPQRMRVLNGKWHPNGEIVSLYGYNKTTMIRLKN